MKKFVTLLVCCCAAAVFAGDVEIKDVINKAKIGDNLIPGWILNPGPGKDVGTGVVVQGSEKDEKAFKITSTKVRTAFFQKNPIRAKAGDKIKFSADVKGRGTFVVGYYAYLGNNKFIPVKDSFKNFPLNGRNQEFEFEFVISNGIKDEVIYMIRPFIAGAPKTEVTIEDLEIEIDYKDR